MLAFNLALDRLVLVGLLATSIHWLIARSAIARPLWSRATRWLDALLRCAGCSGWWIGLGLGWAGLRPLGTGRSWADIVAVGLLAVFLVPVFEGVLVWGLSASSVGASDDEQQPR